MFSPTPTTSLLEMGHLQMNVAESLIAPGLWAQHLMWMSCIVRHAPGHDVVRTHTHDMKLLSGAA